MCCIQIDRKRQKPVVKTVWLSGTHQQHSACCSWNDTALLIPPCTLSLPLALLYLCKCFPSIPPCFLFALLFSRTFIQEGLFCRYFGVVTDHLSSRLLSSIDQKEGDMTAAVSIIPFNTHSGRQGTLKYYNFTCWLARRWRCNR